MLDRSQFATNLLMCTVTRLKACVREIDTVARFGGDEFVVLLDELALTHVWLKLSSTASSTVSNNFSIMDNK